MEVGTRKRIYDELLDYLDGELKSKTGELLERAERTLSTAWMEIKDPERQTAARTTARWLKDNKAAVHNALYMRLLVALSTPPDPKVEETDEQLQMMDETTLNVVVTRARMVNRILDRSRPQIKALEARLEAIGETGTTLNAQALDPGHIADGYLSVLQELEVPDHARGLLMEIYGDRSVELLVHFYEGINEMLAKRGVLPDLQVAAGLKAVDASFTLVGAARSGMQDAEFQALQKRIEAVNLSEWRHGKLQAIVMLQAMLVTSIHEAAIDKVEAYFVDLLQDERISQRVRMELNRLVATFFVVCMDDLTMLDAPKGPINVFVKQLSLLGMRDQESKIEGFDRIDAVVGRIISERGENIKSFQSGSQVLYTIARSEVQRRVAQLIPKGPEESTA